MAKSFASVLPALIPSRTVLRMSLSSEAEASLRMALTRAAMLTGIRVEISGEKVVLAATDRFRLAVRELTWSTESADIEAAVLVPAKTLAEAAKAGADGAEVHLSLGAGSAVGKEGLLGIRDHAVT